MFAIGLDAEPGVGGGLAGLADVEDVRGGGDVPVDERAGHPGVARLGDLLGVNLSEGGLDVGGGDVACRGERRRGGGAASASAGAWGAWVALGALGTWRTLRADRP